MTRHMFVTTHNHWFSRLALLASLIVLSGMVLESYTQLMDIANLFKIRAELFQTYLTHGISILVIFLTFAAMYLHRELGFKPFVICLGLLCLTVSQYFVTQWSGYMHLATNVTFAQTLVKLCMLSLFWWLSAITGPRENVFVSENNKKYKLWAWLGFLLLFSQMLLSVWLITNHADPVCTDFPYCNGQFIPEMDFHALLVLPLSHSGLITLHMLYRICAIVTTCYLIIFSLSVIYNRALGEMGILIFFFMLAQIILGILGWVLQTSFWISFGHSIVSVLVLLAIISLLIELHRKYMTSY